VQPRSRASKPSCASTTSSAGGGTRDRAPHPRHAAMTDLARDFMRELSVVERAGFSTTESMRLFIDQAFYALHGRTVTGAAFDDNERRYMANVERLRDPSAHPALARALGIV